jgi:hypothetical protein
VHAEEPIALAEVDHEATVGGPAGTSGKPLDLKVEASAETPILEGGQEQQHSTHTPQVGFELLQLDSYQL